MKIAVFLVEIVLQFVSDTRKDGRFPLCIRVWNITVTAASDKLIAQHFNINY
jgi:hypothetical protein